MLPVLGVELELSVTMDAAILFIARHMGMLMGFSVPFILILVCAKVTLVPNAGVLVYMTIQVTSVLERLLQFFTMQ